MKPSLDLFSGADKIPARLEICIMKNADKSQKKPHHY